MIEAFVITALILLFFSPVLFGPKEMAPWEIGEDV